MVSRSWWLLVCLGSILVHTSHALAMPQEIYNVPGSGWTAPDWNWGYAQGSGHTCAAICRDLYATREARDALVRQLLDAQPEPPVPEIKLILALEWQRGRWDGTDGGRGGYGDVLSTMAAAKRYEEGSEEECLQRLVEDMAARFHLLKASDEDVKKMAACTSASNADIGFRKCSGMVLQAMGFVERGL